MKEIKDDINRRRAIPCSWVGRIDLVKMTILPNCNLQIQCDPYQNTNGIFHRTRTKKFHNSYGNTKDPQIAKAVLRKKNGAGGIKAS